MELNIDNIILTVCIEANKQFNETGLRIKFADNSYFVRNQTIDETSYTIKKNYEIVKNYYTGKTGTKIDSYDLTCVCLRIVLNSFIMYNNWRAMYKKEKNRDLTFLIDDFDNFDTKRYIIDYFEEKYPNDYSTKCKIMMDISDKEFEILDIRRKQFENMW